MPSQTARKAHSAARKLDTIQRTQRQRKPVTGPANAATAAAPRRSWTRHAAPDTSPRTKTIEKARRSRARFTISRVRPGTLNRHKATRKPSQSERAAPSRSRRREAKQPPAPTIPPRTEPAPTPAAHTAPTPCTSTRRAPPADADTNGELLNPLDNRYLFLVTYKTAWLFYPIDLK